MSAELRIVTGTEELLARCAMLVPVTTISSNWDSGLAAALSADDAKPGTKHPDAPNNNDSRFASGDARRIPPVEVLLVFHGTSLPYKRLLFMTRLPLIVQTICLS